jgi:hypothetical protein
VVLLSAPPVLLPLVPGVAEGPAVPAGDWLGLVVLEPLPVVAEVDVPALSDDPPADPDVCPPAEGALGLGLVGPVLLLLPAEGEVAPEPLVLGVVMEPDAPELPDELLPGPAAGAIPPGDTVLPGGQSCWDLVASPEPAPLPLVPLGLEPVL